ncbi:O-glucosyltransferase rumi [Chionoecetes opilio]|uniref:O-glucosyltransferase rumi n=1 Tax=Chionoecetes opilio TaxID=41210 RepID=A0A8J4YR50_CHIOP|nr:O-glucosyltransferase rumi [Chionoecetes opilio]
MNRLVTALLLISIGCHGDSEETCHASQREKCSEETDHRFTRYSRDANEKWAHYIAKIDEAMSAYKPCAPEKCSCHYHLIKKDLSVFKDGISKETVQSAKERGTFYQIIDHELYRQEDCMFPSRCSGVEHFILKIIDKLPDMELVVNTRDWPQIHHAYGSTVPVFSFNIGLYSRMLVKSRPVEIFHRRTSTGDIYKNCPDWWIFDRRTNTSEPKAASKGWRGQIALKSVTHDSPLPGPSACALLPPLHVINPLYQHSHTTDEYLDITYPAWTFWEGGPAISLYPTGLGRWDLHRTALAAASKKWPWAVKKDQAFFRGSRTSSERDPLVYLSRDSPDLVDAQYTKNQAWKSDARCHSADVRICSLLMGVRRRGPGSSLLSLLFGGALGAGSLGLSALAALAALVVLRHGRCLLLLRKQQLLELGKGVSHVLGSPRDGAEFLGLALAWSCTRTSKRRSTVARQPCSTLLFSALTGKPHVVSVPGHCCLLLVFLLFITL